MANIPLRHSLNFSSAASSMVTLSLCSKSMTRLVNIAFIPTVPLFPLLNVSSFLSWLNPLLAFCIVSANLHTVLVTTSNIGISGLMVISILHVGCFQMFCITSIFVYIVFTWQITNHFSRPLRTSLSILLIVFLWDVDRYSHKDLIICFPQFICNSFSQSVNSSSITGLIGRWGWLHDVCLPPFKSLPQCFHCF